MEVFEDQVKACDDEKFVIRPGEASSGSVLTSPAMAVSTQSFKTSLIWKLLQIVLSQGTQGLVFFSICYSKWILCVKTVMQTV